MKKIELKMDLRSSQKPSTFYGSTVGSYSRTEKAKDDVADQRKSNGEKKVKVLIL